MKPITALSLRSLFSPILSKTYNSEEEKTEVQNSAINERVECDITVVHREY